MQQYNPAIHHRRSIRLKGYDYAWDGQYFITICCQDRVCRFGHVENGKMVLNELGRIAHAEWEKLPQRYQHISLGAFQIMPNHMHGIIVINPPQQSVGTILAVVPGAVGTETGAGASPAPTAAPTVGDIVGAYKSLVANGCLAVYKQNNATMGKLWQRNYWEHIIRDERAYQTISHYIINNPTKWETDKLYKHMIR
jgi:putative transposase